MSREQMPSVPLSTGTMIAAFFGDIVLVTLSFVGEGFGGMRNREMLNGQREKKWASHVRHEHCELKSRR